MLPSEDLLSVLDEPQPLADIDVFTLELLPREDNRSQFPLG